MKVWTRFAIAAACGAVAGLLTTPRERAPLREPASVSAAATSERSTVTGALAETHKRIAEGNLASRRQRALLSSEGWSLRNDVAPPNALVQELSPEALKEHESELQVQLQSNSFGPAQLKRVRDLALATDSEKTRYVAVEALGRSTSPEAQALLVSVYEGVRDDATRSQILAALKPASSGDATAAFLVARLGDNSTSDPLKEQAAFALIGMTLTRDAPDDLTPRLPSEWQERYSQMLAMVRAGGKQ